MPGKLTYGSLDMASDAGDPDLPSQVDLRRDGVVPPIQNQRWNNCVGWALGYYVMSALEMRHHREHAWFTGEILDPGDRENWFSPDYVYGQREFAVADIVERSPHLSTAPICLEQDGLLGCMRPELAIARILVDGCCRWPLLCAADEDGLFRSCGGGDASTTSRAPWAFAQPNGFWFRPRCFVRFGVLQDPGQGARTSPAGQMQHWLYRQGTPIAIVVEMKEGWVTYRGENRTQAPVLFRNRNDGLMEERAACLDAGGRSLGSQHMMAIIGYDREFLRSEANPEGSFLIANQWGAKWGHDGYMWIPVTELEKIWIGGYGLIKWIGGSSGMSLSGPKVCAPDEFGEFFLVSVEEGGDGNDVPRNVVRTDGQYVYKPTATPLTLSDGRAEVQELVGGVQGGAIDAADWYELGDGLEGQTLSCTLQSAQQGDAGPVVRMKVTDTDLRSVGVFCPETGVTTATLGRGPHFIKVEPTYGAGYEALPPESRVSYTLGVRRVQTLDEDCDVVASVSTAQPLLRSELEVEIESQAWRCFRFDLASLQALGWVQDREALCPGDFTYHVANNDRILQERQIVPRIEVRGLADGQAVEVVAANPTPWWFACLPLRGFRDFEVCRVKETGLDLVLRPGSKHPGLTSFNEWQPFVAIRNTSPEPVRLTLALSILPPRGEPNDRPPDDPGMEEVAVGEHPPWWVPGSGSRANRFRILPDEPWRNPDTEMIELRHSSPTAQLRLVDEMGNALGGFRLEDLSAGADAALTPPGVVRQRVRFPAGWTGDVWVEAYEGDGTTPLRNLRLRRYHVNTLAVWPMSAEARVDPVEQDNEPSRARPLREGSPLSAEIGFTLQGAGGGYAWDFYDYYIVETPAGAQGRRATLELTKTGGDDANLHVFRWRMDDPDRPRLEDVVSQFSQQARFPLLGPSESLAPGSRALVLVFSGTQVRTRYQIALTWD